MKICTRMGVLAVGMLCLGALQGHAQTLSPRTGHAPTTQTLTLEQFNRLPSEIQVIMKQHPDRFIIDQGPKDSPTPVHSPENKEAQPTPPSDAANPSTLRPAAPSSMTPTSELKPSQPDLQ